MACIHYALVLPGMMALASLLFNSVTVALAAEKMCVLRDIHLVPVPITNTDSLGSKVIAFCNVNLVGWSGFHIIIVEDTDVGARCTVSF